MAPAKKKPKDEEEARALERRRKRYREYYRRRREQILDNNRKYHQRNKENINERRKLNGKQQREREKELRKIARAMPVGTPVVLPAEPTLASVAGFISGDGCIHDNNTVSAVCVTLDVLESCKSVVGGSISKRGNYYWWRASIATRRGVDHNTEREALAALAPFCLTKYHQIVAALEGDSERVKALKYEPPILPDTTDFTDDEKAQIVAGFFSADGHVRVRGKSARPYVVFGQKYREILDFIQENFGGGSEIGVYNPTANGEKTHKGTDEKYVAYQLTYSGDAAINLLARIEPYVLVASKRECCRLAMAGSVENMEETVKRIAQLTTASGR